jgi:hypothetical protein
MTKTMIAAALAALMLSATGASAASKHKQHIAAGSKATQAYARDLGAVSAQSSGGDWDNRSLFYRGPTYIGRY